MKVTKININDLLATIEIYLQQGIQYIDAEIIESKNTIRFTTSFFEDNQESEIA